MDFESDLTQEQLLSQQSIYQQRLDASEVGLTVVLRTGEKVYSEIGDSQINDMHSLSAFLKVAFQDEAEGKRLGQFLLRDQTAVQEQASIARDEEIANLNAEVTRLQAELLEAHSAGLAQVEPHSAHSTIHTVELVTAFASLFLEGMHSRHQGDTGPKVQRTQDQAPQRPQLETAKITEDLIPQYLFSEDLFDGLGQASKQSKDKSHKAFWEIAKGDPTILKFGNGLELAYGDLGKSENEFYMRAVENTEDQEGQQQVKVTQIEKPSELAEFLLGKGITGKDTDEMLSKAILMFDQHQISLDESLLKRIAKHKDFANGISHTSRERQSWAELIRKSRRSSHEHLGRAGGIVDQMQMHTVHQGEKQSLQDVLRQAYIEGEKSGLRKAWVVLKDGQKVFFIIDDGVTPELAQRMLQDANITEELNAYQSTHTNTYVARRNAAFDTHNYQELAAISEYGKKHSGINPIKIREIRLVKKSKTESAVSVLSQTKDRKLNLRNDFTFHSSPPANP